MDDTELFGRIVRVEARFKVGRSKIGTGFRLAPGRILTAQHVLERRVDGRTLNPESVRVRHDPDGDGNYSEARAQVIWRGEEILDPDDPRALDAALLEDGLPGADLAPFHQLVRLPQPKGEFWGAGFVKVSSSQEELCLPDGLTGSFDPVRQHATSVNLRILGAPPEEEEGRSAWGGISGAPIFIWSKDHPKFGALYGVMRRTIGSYPDRVSAVATTALWRNAVFRESLGLKEPPPPHERLVVASRRLLEKNPRIARHLARQDPVWKGAWEAHGTEGLLEAVCREGDVGTLLDGLLVLVEESPNDLVEMAALRESAVHLVGLLAHHELMRFEGVEKMAKGRYRVPVTSPNFAEASFASEEGRAPLYRRPAGSGDQQSSYVDRELEIPINQLESGLESHKASLDQLEEMAAVLVEKDLDQAPFLRDEQRRAISGADQAKKLRLLAKAINANLKRLARKKGGRFYFLLTPDRQNQLSFRLDEFLTHLHGLLPDLVYLELHGDAEKGLELEAKLLPLWDILGIEDQGETGR